MKEAESFFKNAVLLSLGGAAAQILGFLVTVILAQRLGVTLFGEISFAQSSLVYLILLADPGLKILGTREIAGSQNVLSETVRAIWSLRILLAIGIALLWSAFIAATGIEPPRSWLLWGYGMAILPMAISTDWIFTGLERLSVVAVSRLVRSLLHISLVFFLVKSPVELILVPILFGFSHLSASLYLFIITKRDQILPKMCLEKGAPPSVLRAALPLGISSAMIQVYYHLDSIILGIIRTPRELGYYSAGYKVVLFLIAIGDAIALALLPTLSRLAANLKSDRLKELLPELVKLLAGFGLGITIIILCLAGDIIAFLYGDIYSPGTTALTILSITIFAVFGSLSFGILLLATHREKKYTISVSCGAAANLILNFLLIPPYGITGAATATVISEVAVWFMYIKYLGNYRQSIPWFSLFGRLIFPGLLTLLVLQTISGHVILRAAGSAFIYLLTARLAGIWSIASLRKLSRILDNE